jgi:hypothetical protein
MTDDSLASPIPLTGPDAQVLHYLAQVVAIGRHNHAWTAADVQRVAEAHLNHPHTLRRQLLNERVRADTAAAEVQLLRLEIARLRTFAAPEPRLSRRLPREHGTERGYHQHRSRHDWPICGPCKAAHTRLETNRKKVREAKGKPTTEVWGKAS